MNGMRKIRLITRIALFVLMLLPMTAFAEDEGFTWEPQNPRVGERVTFTGPDTDSFHSQSVTRWTWTWPDNTKKEGINTKVSDYTFTTAGKNTVTLNVQYDDGRGDTFSHDIIVSKYQPKVDITSGNGIADFTAKVGDVGDRYVNFILPPDMPKSIEVTYSIGQVSVTGKCYSSTFGGNDFLCGAARLNSLPAGDYPIKLSSPGNDQVEGFDLTLGTAHIEEKYQPKVDIIGGDGSADFTAKVGDVGNRDVDFRLPPDIPKSIEVTYSIGQVRVTDNISFGQYKQTLDSADLNSLPAGNYPIKLSSPGMIKSRGSILHWGQRISRSIS